MKSLFEQMGGTYRRVGDYYIPNLVLGEEYEYHVGRYGLMHKKYLEETNPILYTSMTLSGKLWAYLAEIDQTCNERAVRDIRQAKQKIRCDLKGSSDGDDILKRLCWKATRNSTAFPTVSTIPKCKPKN